MNANVGNKAIKEHKAAINEPKSLGPKNSHPRVLENLFKWYLMVNKQKKVYKIMKEENSKTSKILTQYSKFQK